jgi:hypothetical protein
VVELTAQFALTWGVRGSFLHYVSAVAHGTVETAGGATVDEHGVFAFPVVSVEQDGTDWRLAFSGSVRFTAHHGFLDLLLLDPKVVIGPGGGVVGTRTDAGSDRTTPVVTLPGIPPVLDGDVLEWEGLPTLLVPSAVPLFGDVYPAGTPMDPLGMRAALSS